MKKSNPSPKLNRTHHWNLIFICLFIIIASLFVYWQVGSHEFISFDDPVYVTNNHHVHQGISLDNVIWAFGLSKSADRVYWHPLTWMSHMLDWQLFGNNAGMHHFENLLIHIINALLLLLVLKQMTGSFWKSAFVAALFAVHPLNVDTVAWVAERKNVLSTLFWMLTLLTYGYYVKKPSVLKYLFVLTSMALGLMAKPMLVTLPCVMLLLDFWPLNRLQFFQQENDATGAFNKKQTIQLLLEKLPLLALSLIAIGLSVISLKYNGQTAPNIPPMLLRLENGLVSYIDYIIKIIWPHNMAVFYPFPDFLPLWQVLGAVAIIAGLSVIFICSVKKAPYLLIGWLWFLGTLVPVIGIVQGGRWPAMADRWMYVPEIGLFIMISWGMGSIVKNRYHLRIIVTAIAATILFSFIMIANKQVTYWKNNITLYKHAVRVTDKNEDMYVNLGASLTGEGHTDEAIDQYFKALRINPRNADAHYNMGNAYKKMGSVDKAVQQYLAALHIKPDFADAHYNLGMALSDQGRLEEAVQQYLDALRIKPDFAKAHYYLGMALSKMGRLKEAAQQYSDALRIKPDFADAHYNLGMALLHLGQINGAMKQYEQALKINPDFAEAHNNLATALLTQGRMHDAIQHYLQAIRIKPDYADAHYNLGIALINKGDIDGAIACFRKALQLNPNDQNIQDTLKKALALQKHQQTNEYN